MQTQPDLLAQTKLQRWLNTVECIFNEIHRSKNTMLTLQTEGGSQQHNEIRPISASPAELPNFAQSVWNE